MRISLLQNSTGIHLSSSLIFTNQFQLSLFSLVDFSPPMKFTPNLPEYSFSPKNLIFLIHTVIRTGWSNLPFSPII